MTVVMRVLLPIRRAWRRLRFDVICVTEDGECDEEVVAIWRRFSGNAVMLHIRRAVGFMGVVGCANALWRLLMHGATHDDRITHGNGREATTTSAGVNIRRRACRSLAAYISHRRLMRQCSAALWDGTNALPSP